MSGFIDPSARDASRLDRLEVLIDAALRKMGLDWMAPDVRAVYDDLTSKDPARAARARAVLKDEMEADPLGPEDGPR